MTNIKIFVSHRNDIQSVIVKNSIYFPVICGAVYKKNFNDIQGDNVEENISLKKNRLSELTVQYWAWKNFSADYYGLCHYRRYLSFGDNKNSNRNSYQEVSEIAISEKSLKRHRLNSESYIRDYISNYDVLYGEGANVCRIKTLNGYPSTVRELWEAHNNIYFDKECLSILLKKIKELYPQYYGSAIDYLNSNKHIGFNCFVMKKDLFNMLCEFQFSILEIMENILDNNKYLEKSPRTLGYLGEILYGIYIYHLKNKVKLRIGTLPIVFFHTTSPLKGFIDLIKRKILVNMKIRLNGISLIFFPIGTKRRLILKKILMIK